MKSISVPLQKPAVIDLLKSSLEEAQVQIDQLLQVEASHKIQQSIDWIFWTCVELLKVWGDVTGLGYNLINILIFILIQPGLIILFFTLWIYEKNKTRSAHYG